MTESAGTCGAAMRFILWLGLALGLVWGGYWFVGSLAIKTNAETWFAGAEARGLVAKNAGLSVAGFPSRFDMTVTEPALSEPVSGWGWTAPFAQFLSMSWKPWHIIAVLPPEQEFAGPDQTIAVTSGKMQVSLRLSQSADPNFEGFVIEGRDLTAKSDQGWQIGASSLVLALRQDAVIPFGQHLGFEVHELRPDAALAALVPELGTVMETVHLDATLTLTGPLDRHITDTAPAIAKVDLKDFSAVWGAFLLSATGQLEAAEDGRATGQIDIRIENWKHVPALLVALGLVPPEMRTGLIDELGSLAAASAEPQVLNLTLTFAEGWTKLGPVRLGPAPMLDWKGLWWAS